MTRRKSTPPEAALVAIDVAKHRNEAFIDPGIGRRRRMTVLNTRADHDRFIATLHALARPVIVGIEPTGNYHRVLAHRLIVAGFGVQLISSMALARTREALHNGWDKKLKAKTGIWHRLLTHYLPLYFPEIERFAGNSRSDWFLAFLERFPTPDSITALAKDTFVATAWDVVGRKVSKARLLGDIYETARISAALPVPLDAPAIAMFRLVLAEARSLVRQRNVIEAQAHELRRTHPDYLRLRQVLGIGPTHALTILAEAGDLRRFQFRGQTRLSKFGTPACDGPFGWRPRSQSISAITASAITSAVTSPRIATTRICGARR